VSSQPGDPRSDAPEAQHEICCSMTRGILALMREENGEEAVDQLLREADSQYTADYLSRAENWISLDEAITLLTVGQRITGDPLFARHVGEAAVRHNLGSQVATLQRSQGSLHEVLASVPIASGRFSTVTEMTTIESVPGRAVLTAQARPGYVRYKVHCQWTAGLLAHTSLIFGLAPSEVVETECQAEGGERCVYQITWDAEEAAEMADPSKRVTALEAQLVAMSKRLRSVYETASDLTSPDELDVVLPRILDRAANTVRAPRYVLAVRTSPSADLRVYCDGLGESEAHAIVSSIELGHQVDKSGVVATVASGRRAYGYLIALTAPGSEFFPQERELLELYAKHAAAVLDMATALEEAARRHQDVSALLSMSESLAQAGTSSDVGDRLAESIPTVLDCDHVAVYSWEPDARALIPLAVRGQAGPREDRLRTASVDPSLAADLLGARRPRFFDSATDNRPAARMMEDGGFKAMAVVPIVAHDAFLGAIVVAVADRPVRLTYSGELVERLTGVASLAAPPLQNGRLIDKLRHQATHDPLTGLFNRAGFSDHVGGTFEAASGSVGLLFIDLNGFKPINDTHGHQVGDELLRLVSRRLAALVRVNDAVGRLGGDEFAIVLSDVAEPQELEAATRRVREAFADPFVLGDVTVSVTASVGSALWPDGASDAEDLVRKADLDMYREKQSRKIRSAA
jgi:diguanylate cyclase (GGDEF)-like protein